MPFGYLARTEEGKLIPEDGEVNSDDFQEIFRFNISDMGADTPAVIERVRKYDSQQGRAYWSYDKLWDRKEVIIYRFKEKPEE